MKEPQTGNWRCLPGSELAFWQYPDKDLLLGVSSPLKYFRFKTGRLFLASLIASLLISGIGLTEHQEFQKNTPSGTHFEKHRSLHAGTFLCNADEELTETTELCACTSAVHTSEYPPFGRNIDRRYHVQDWHMAAFQTPTYLRLLRLRI